MPIETGISPTAPPRRISVGNALDNPETVAFPRDGWQIFTLIIPVKTPYIRK